MVAQRTELLMHVCATVTPRNILKTCVRSVVEQREQKAGQEFEAEGEALRRHGCNPAGCVQATAGPGGKAVWCGAREEGGGVRHHEGT